MGRSGADSQKLSGQAMFGRGSHPRPLVLIVPDDHGLCKFYSEVARFFARAGYVGLTVDLFGDTMPDSDRGPGASKESRKAQVEAVLKLVSEPAKLRRLAEAWLNRGKYMAQVDLSDSAAVGFGWGGAVAQEFLHGGTLISAVVVVESKLNLSYSDEVLQELELDRPDVAEGECVAENPGPPKRVLGYTISSPFDQRVYDVHHKWDAYGLDFCHMAPANVGCGFIFPGSEYSSVAEQRVAVELLSFFAEVFPHVERHPVDRSWSGCILPDAV
mmetsp:Transcript_59848/g.160220  ORF Transcript_59848/g.160220 Transcript_59848/m.160220 type:complete len:272 (-) Transcript_59848:220-1035(-)